MPIEIIQIANGYGAGNIGDELMGHAFWQSLPEEVHLEVCLFPGFRRQHLPYPERFTYREVDDPGSELLPDDNRPGILVGTTLVTEDEGLHWPLEFLARRLKHFHDRGLPVDAVGVGVDRLESAEARAIFQDAFLPIRSWTVRSEHCRQALLELNVPDSRIAVGADFGWLHESPENLADWAKHYWTGLNINPSNPLVVVDIVSEHLISPFDEQQPAAAGRDAIAAALDELHSKGFQIAFFGNECGNGERSDRASALDLRARMQAPLTIVPNKYFSPAEAIALLRHASATISERYHFTVESVLAGTVPLNLPRGQKMRGLSAELDLTLCPPRAELNPAELVARVTSAAKDTAVRKSLAAKREFLHERAKLNLRFFNERYFSKPSVFLMQMGGLGDLVLSSRLVAALKSQHPDVPVTFACRAKFAAFPALFPVPPDEVFPIAIDPGVHIVPDSDVTEQLSDLLASLATRRLAVFLAADYELCWLHFFLAAAFQAPKSVASAVGETPRGLLPVMLDRFRLSAAAFEGPGWRPGMNEPARYKEIARYLGCAEEPFRNWPITAVSRQQAGLLLAAWEWKPGSYAVCFPMCAQSGTIKRWPPEHFVEVLATKATGMPVLVAGSQMESNGMEEIAGQLRKRGIDSRVFAGGDADLALLAGLIAHARIWIGNDTGPAHLAQAYGIPGVVVFGGGHWPAYAPWGRGVIGFVHPLPCFGCEWSCAFGHGICVESIPPAAVCDGFAEALANPGQPAKVEALDRVPANSLKIIGEAAAAFRATELDRRSLFSATVEMEYRQARTEEAAARIAAEVAATKEEWLRQPLDPEFLLQVLGARDVDIRGLRAEVDNQRKTIIELDRAAAERLVQMLAAIERENAIELEARKRASAIDDLHEMISVRELRIAELESTADERLQLIHKAEKQWKDAAAEAVRQGRAAAERLSLIESTAAQLRAVTHEAEERLAKLQSSEEQNKSLAAEAATHAKTAQERLELIESIDAQLKSVTEAANERLSMLQTADEQNRDLATEAATHAKAARERLELIETIDAQLKSVTAAANERARDVDELTRIAEERLSLLRAAEQQLANVTAESQDRAIAIDELRQLLSERDEELQSQRATSEGLSARLAVTESNESRLQREVEQFRAETLLDMIKRSLHSIRK